MECNIPGALKYIVSAFAMAVSSGCHKSLYRSTADSLRYRRLAIVAEFFALTDSRAAENCFNGHNFTGTGFSELFLTTRAMM